MLVLAHHGPVVEHHATAGGAEMPMHVMHDAAPAPADGIDLVEICAAVLPGLLLLALALGGGSSGVRRWRLQVLRRPLEVLIGARALDRRARAGPRVLCVMRC